MDDAGVVLLFRDKAYLHPEKARTSGCDKSVGNLLYAVSTSIIFLFVVYTFEVYDVRLMRLHFPLDEIGCHFVHRPALINYIVSVKIKSPAQLDASLSFLSNVGSEYLDIGKIEKACGVGPEEEICALQFKWTLIRTWGLVVSMAIDVIGSPCLQA
ncbi:hypothetical protein ACQ4PT_061133 [Festuca glaucescens]